MSWREYGLNKKNMKASTILYVILVIALVYGIYWLYKNGYFGNSAERQLAVKCCIERDANCNCTSYVYKKSEDCETVPCPELHYTVQNPANDTMVPDYWVMNQPTAAMLANMANGKR